MNEIWGHSPTDTDSRALALGRAIGAPADACDREIHLYARYVRALALLCECAPYVDEASHAELIDEVLTDASANYPITWRRNGRGIDLSPQGVEGEPRVAPMSCGP